MHTVVIHFGKKYEDWHLVEPFFYKLQTQKQLTFYWEEEAISSQPLFLSLVDRMVEYLDRHRIKDWQLIILLNLNDQRNRQKRLTTQLSEIKVNLLYELKDKGFYPLQILIHLVDMIKRNSAYAPTDEVLRRYWELDHYGFIQTDQDGPLTGNAFTLKEIKELDKEWGEAVKLQNVEVDTPSQEFVDKLREKCARVTAILDIFTIQKRGHFEKDGDIKESDDWMTIDQIQAIYEDFLNKMSSFCTPPLKTSLTTFTPSKELSDSLKYHVGIQREMGDIRLVRQEIVQGSHRERIKGYLELTYFILTVSHHPNLIDRIDKGSSNVIHVTLEEDRLEKLLKNYYVSLVKAKRQLEEQLITDNQYHTNRLREEESLPYTAKSLEKIEKGKLLPKIPKITPSFFDQWQDRLFQVETNLSNREKELVRSSREAIKRLNVLKRKNDFQDQEELVEINDYQQELLQQIGVAHQAVIDSAPSLAEALRSWQKHADGAKRRMDFLLQCVPISRQLWLVSSLIFLVLLFPYLHTWQSSITRPWGYFGLAVTLLMVLFTLFGYRLTQKKSHRPIYHYQEQTKGYAEEMQQLQTDSQHEYNNYLNHLYQLFTLRKHFEKITSIGEGKKGSNMLLHYHLIQLGEFVQLTNRLLHILQIDKELPLDKQLENRVPGIRFDQNVIDNPTYSPFLHQGLLPQDGHKIEVYLGSAREQYESMYMNELDKIRIQEDKVYKI
jgi:hypothetical protein